MGEPSLRPVATVDIGTNSMRLLITDGRSDLGRWSEVTGLGTGVDETRKLSEDRISGTLEVLMRYGQLMDEAGAAKRAGVATSATRDASNGEKFLDAAAEALGFRPELVPGDEEGRLAFTGATARLEAPKPHVVCDIGGGSTELVRADAVASIDLGSVRLTDRLLPDRPARRGQVERALEHSRGILESVAPGEVGTLVGVAGTWTSLAAIDIGDGEPGTVHGHELIRRLVGEEMGRLAELTLDETEQIPGLHPARAPVILAGAIVAAAVMDHLGVDRVRVSERDLLDGLALRLLEARD